MGSRALKPSASGDLLGTRSQSETITWTSSGSWLKDESLEDADNLPEPEDLVSEAVTQLEAALDAPRDLSLKLQENGK